MPQGQEATQGQEAAQGAPQQPTQQPAQQQQAHPTPEGQPVEPHVEQQAAQEVPTVTEETPAKLEATLLGRSGADDEPGEAVSFRDMIGEDLLQDRTAALAVRFLETALPADVDMQRALGAAIETGDLSKVDTNYLSEVLDGETEDVFSAIEQMFEVADKINEEFSAALYAEIPGGQEALEQAAKVFHANAESHQVEAMRYLLDSGNIELAKFAAHYVYETTRANGGIVDAGTQSFGQPGGLQGMSRAEFAEAIQKPGLTEAEHQVLRQRRQIGMQQNL